MKIPPIMSLSESRQSTSYEPSTAGGRWNRLFFDGDEQKYVVVITQREGELTFQEFKVMLRNYESTENARRTSDDDSVMQASFRGKCFACGKWGHMSKDCDLKTGPNQVSGRKPKMWCSFCRRANHTDRTCRRKKGASKDSSRYVNSDVNGDSGGCHSFVFLSTEETPNNPKNTLLVDCGATAHIITDQSYFVGYDRNFQKANHFIELADGTRSNNVALKRGNAVMMLTDVKGRKVEATLQNALYIPSYPCNIFSVKAATDHGATIKFGPKTSEMIAADGTKFNIEQHGRLYYFSNGFSDSSTDRKEISCVNKIHDLEMWHKILGHCNISDVMKLEQVVDGMNISSTDKFNCETCVMSKQTLTRSREPRLRTKNRLDLVHTDVVGPIEPMAKDGFRFGITFTDDYSGLIFVYFLKHKNQAVKALEQFLADTAPYGKTKCIRSDNGTEYTCKEFQDVLRKNLIKHETSAPYSPHQNGTAERGMRTLFEIARCLLQESGLPKNLWTYAVMASAYIRNRCYCQRIQQTPFYMFSDKKPNLNNMHIFGRKCFVYETLPKKKLDARSREGIFVGYDKGSPAYLVYHPDTKNVKKYRCVKFFDSESDNIGTRGSVSNDEDFVIPDHTSNSAESTENEDITQDETDDVPDERQEGNTRRLPPRVRKMPERYQDYVTDDTELDDQVNYSVDYCYKLVVGIPKSFEEAMSGPDAKQWKYAMEDEMKSLKSNDTYSITQIPEGRQSVGGRWVYALKEGPDGNIRYKARYVAKGYSQKEGVDYYETFSPTARMTSLRIMMQLAAEYNLCVHQLDVKTAYLNAPIDCEIYVEQPEGFRVNDSDKDLVWRLNKSLYGLKQSGRNWNCVLHEYLIQNNFTQSLVDTCIYIRNSEDSRIIMLVWVDDIIITASSETSMIEIKSLLKRRFKMTDLGQLHWFLGIQFNCENGEIRMNQSHYLKKVLSKYGMDNCKPKATPSEQKLNFSDDLEIVDVIKYREMVGSLVYAMTCTRPDLCWIVTKLSQYLSKPTVNHHTAVKRVLRYVSATLDYELCFKCSHESLKVFGFSDADWGSSEDRRSTTGYCFKVGSRIVSWKSKKQQTVALSSCEAEYMALSAATQEALFINQLISDMDNDYKHENKPTVLCSDNQGAIALAKNPVNHQRSKHIDIKYHFIRSQIGNGKIELVYVPSENNIADVFTKPLGKIKFQAFVKKLFA